MTCLNGKITSRNKDISCKLTKIFHHFIQLLILLHFPKIDDK